MFKNLTTLNALASGVSNLLLEATADELAEKKPTEISWMTKASNIFGQMFLANPLNLEEKADQETTERNKEKVIQLFDKIKDKLDDQKDSVLDQLVGMTREQQEGVVEFWTEAYDFLIKVFEWMRDVFNLVVEKINQGFLLAKETIRGLFASVMGLIRKVF